MSRLLLCLPLVLLVGCAYEMEQRERYLGQVRALTSQLENLDSQLKGTSLSPSHRNELELQRRATAERLATASEALAEASAAVKDKAQGWFGLASQVLGVFLAGGGVAAGAVRGMGGP